MIDLRKVKKIVNLTPHPLVFVDEGGNKILEIPPSGIVPRVKIEREVIGHVEVEGVRIEVRKTKVVAEVNPPLPEPEEGTIYVVSKMVAEALKDREDVFIVDEAVKGENGFTVGVRGLALNPGMEEGQTEDFELHYIDSFNDQLEFGVGVQNGEGYVLAANDMGEFRFKIPPELAHKLAKEVSSVKNLIPYKNSLDVTEDEDV